MLDTFITSRVRRKIVIVFSKYPDFKSHVRALAKLIKEDAGNVQRELKKLEEVGFLKSSKLANAKLYQADTSFAIFPELQSIIAKVQALQEQKRNSLKNG